MRGDHGRTEVDIVTSEPADEAVPPDGEDRRSDPVLRRQILELLGLIREFYTTCHMVAVGQLEPSKAKAKARSVEEKLRAMMSETLERLAEGAEMDPPGEPGDDA